MDARVTIWTGVTALLIVASELDIRTIYVAVCPTRTTTTVAFQRPNLMDDASCDNQGEAYVRLHAAQTAATVGPKSLPLSARIRTSWSWRFERLCVPSKLRDRWLWDLW